MEAIINIAEYAKHLNEVNATLGINLRQDIEDYVRKGTHRGQSMGNTGLLSEIEKNTPLSDNLGKPVRRGGGIDTVPEGGGKWTKGKSGSAVHAAYLWRDEITTQSFLSLVVHRVVNLGLMCQATLSLVLLRQKTLILKGCMVAEQIKSGPEVDGTMWQAGRLLWP